MRRRQFKFVSRRGLTWLECTRLSRLPWLVHAFSTRRGGTSQAPAAGLNLGLIESDRRANVEENRRRFFDRLGARDFTLATLRQVHSAAIYRVTLGASGRLEYQPPGILPRAASENQHPAGPAPDDAGDRPARGDGQEGDAFLTDEPAILLSVRSADCMPVLLVDTRRRAVAAVHAGWRGALERIVEKTVGVMRSVFGSRPRDLVAAIGPSIRACCYEVGEDVLDAFCSRFTQSEKFFRKAPGGDAARTSAQRGTPRLLAARSLLTDARARLATDPQYRPAASLDLVAVAREQLRSADVPASNVHVAEFCTACRTDIFFSHRKEGSRTGRVMAVIGIRQRK